MLKLLKDRLLGITEGFSFHNNNNNNNNDNLYLSRVTPSIARTVINGGPTSKSKWNLEVLVFVEGGKPQNPGKTLGTRQEPRINSTHLRRQVRESNPGHRGGRRALTHCANHVIVILIMGPQNTFTFYQNTFTSNLQSSSQRG